MESTVEFRKKQKLLAVPVAVSALLPKGDEPVSYILNAKLPTIAQSLVLPQPKDWFSKEPPNEGSDDHNLLQILGTRSVPSLKTLEEVFEVFWVAPLKAVRSIVDPNRKQSRLPIWVLKYWREVGLTLEEKKAWCHGDNWLDARTRRLGKRSPEEAQRLISAVDGARQLLQTLEWNQRVAGFRITMSTREFGHLLSEDWLSDNIIDAMMDYIGRKAQRDPHLASSIIVGRLEVANSLVKRSLEPNRNPSSLQVLTGIKSLVQHSKRKILLFPVYPSKTHWAGVKVDFETQTWSYGDSLSHTGFPRAIKEIQALQSWLKAEFGAFKEGPPLKAPLQDDTYSCAVCVASMFEHHLWQERELWSPSNKIIARLEWFTSLVRHHLNSVIPPSLPSEPAHASCTDERSKTSVNSVAEPSVFAIPNLLNPIKPASVVGGLARSPCTSLNPLLGTYEDSHAKDCGSDGDIDGVALDETKCMDWIMDIELAEGNRTGMPGRVQDNFDQTDTNSSTHGMDMEDYSWTIQEDEGDPFATGTSHRPIHIAPKSDGRKRKRQSSPASTSELPNPRKSFLQPMKKMVKGVLGKAVGRLQSPSSGSVGISRSAQGHASFKKALGEGTFILDRTKLQGLTRKLQELDGDFEFDQSVAERTRIRHSVCGGYVKLDMPYQVKKFKEHIATCNGRGRNGKMKATAGTRTLIAMAQRAGWSTSKSLSERPEKAKELMEPHPQDLAQEQITCTTLHIQPCPGLRESEESITPEDRVKIANIFKHVQSRGGGGRSVTRICQEMFGEDTEYASLGKEQQSQVDTKQMLEWRWHYEHESSDPSIRSASCLKDVQVEAGAATRPCDSCYAMLSVREFRNALNKPVPLLENRKHINHKHCQPKLASLLAKARGLAELFDEKNRHSPCVEYALGVLNGEFRDHKVFTGMVEAMVLQADRRHRGLSMRNFKYKPSVDEFAHVLMTISPQAYRFFGDHFQIRTERNFKAIESKKQRFPMDICSRTFTLAQDYLNALSYSGPVALSCDDTKLQPSLRLLWDGNAQAWYLVGGVDGPLAVANPEELEQLLQHAQIEKAPKIRMWCVQVPLPRIPSLVLAAIPISNTSSTKVLLPFLQKIVDGLIDSNIQVISYSCDGTEVERSIQRGFEKLAERTQHYTFPSPDPNGEPLDFPIHFYRGQPITMMQDSKHFSKTMRNNLFSGARALVLGNHVAKYSTIRDIAMSKEGPLYKRDVEKLDRQDDRAAARLFSAQSLDFLVQQERAEPDPSSLGSIVYLFVFGELVDAAQNRHLTHVSRLHMVLRAYFFLKSWKKFLATAGYPESRHFISREAHDIAMILIRGLVSLIIIHRDHLSDDRTYPLLPWLHSTETCEHMFAFMRLIVKDFSLHDAILMVPKLAVQQRAAMLGERGSEDAKARASGYHHTYMDAKDINVHNLTIFPLDSEFPDIAKAAYREHEALFALLGTPVELFSQSIRSAAATRLPPINVWWDDEDGVSSETDAAEEHVDAMAAGEALQGILADEEHPDAPFRSRAQEDALMQSAFAWTSILVDDAMQLEALPDYSAGDLQADSLSVSTCLRLSAPAAVAAPALSLPQVNTEEARLLSDLSPAEVAKLDLSGLVQLRYKNQTHFASAGVRTRFAVVGQPSQKARQQNAMDDSEHEQDDDENTASASMPTLMKNRKRWELVKRMQGILRAQDSNVAIGTGLERKARWMDKDPSATSGNSANAEVVAKAAAQTLIKRRIAALKKHSVTQIARLGDAGLTHFNPLEEGSFGLAYINGQGITIVRVITIYTKEGGKNGKYCWIPQSTHIGGVANIVVQVYRRYFQCDFTPFPLTLGPITAKQYACIPSHCFLYLLTGQKSGGQKMEPRSTLGGQNLTVPLEFSALQQDLQSDYGRISLAVTELTRVRRKRGEKEPEQGEGEEEEE